jgi:hypothetical protein
MFPLKLQNLIKLPIVLITIGALVLGFFCLGIFAKTPMQMSTTGSALMSTAKEKPCCGSGISHHFDISKNTLAVPQSLRDSLMWLVFGLALALGFSRLPFQNLSTKPKLLSYRLYERQHPDLPLFNHLKLAFAKGILNPKIY